MITFLHVHLNILKFISPFLFLSIQKSSISIAPYFQRWKFLYSTTIGCQRRICKYCKSSYGQLWWSQPKW